MNPIRAFGRWLSKAGQSRLITSFMWPGDDGLDQSFPIDYGKAYRSIPIVRACVDAIAADCAAVPLKIKRQRGDELLDVPETDEVARIFATANPRQAAVAMWELHYRRLMTWGNSYLLTDFLGRSTPQELWVLISGGAMKVVTDRAGMIAGYKYRPGPVERVYRPEEIYHARLGADEEYGDLYGISPLSACVLPATLEHATLSHWAAVMKNGGRLSTVVKTKEVLPKEIVEQIKREWAENYGNSGRPGYTKAGKLAVFGGDSELQEIGLTPKEADYIEQTKQVRESVMSVLQVPPARVGVLRSGGLSDANVAEQEALYWQHRILPLLQMTAADLNEIVLPRFGDGYVAAFDYESVPAMQQMQLAKADKLVTLTGGPVMTRNEARDALGLQPVVGGDQLFAPTTVTPFGAVRPAASFSTRKLWKQYNDSPERAAMRAKAASEFEEAERPATLDWTRAITAQEERVARNLRASAKARRKAPEFEEIWDSEIEYEAARAVATRIFMRTVAARGQEAIEAVDPTGEFLLSDPRVAEFLEEQALRESDLIVGRQAEQMRTLLADASRAGLSVQEIAAQIRTLYDVERGRAQTIARTETGRAYNFATREGWEQSGLVARREWLAANDEATREAHADADGQVVGIDEPFQVGGESLMYPGDPNGSAEMTINCFPPETLMQGSFLQALEVWYSGPLRVLVTARGNRLRLTPNHPVLTRRGWIPARDLVEGDDLLSYGGNIRTDALGDIYDERPKATIKQVFDALASYGRRGKRQAADADLHGDGRNTHGQINVVGADRVLEGDGEWRKRGRKFGLVTTHARQPLVHGLGAPNLALQGVAGTSPGAPSGGQLALDEMPLANPLPFQPLRVGPASHSDTCFSEESKQRGAASADAFGQLLQTDAGFVFADQLIEISWSEFSGHVYDLQSVTGWTVAQGIVCGNCRCVELPVVEARSYRVSPGVLAAAVNGNGTNRLTRERVTAEEGR